MGMVTRAMKRRLEEEDLLVDRISSLPDGVLGNMVSLLPTKDGARTQVLSCRWRHLWRSSPLNLDLHDNLDAGSRIDISHILSAHPGPCRRFIMPLGFNYKYPTKATLDSWLRSPKFDNLQELDLHLYGSLLPLSVHRLLPTLCAARLRACWFPDGNDANPLQLPLLKKLTLSDISISESSLHALLAGCPVLESLLLLYSSGFRRLQIVSSTLRSIGVHSGDFENHQLVIEDAPCLERLLYFGGDVDISVISAPGLAVVGNFIEVFPRLMFGATFFQGPTFANSVKVLALCDANLCMDAVLNIMQCFPNLQKLYIKLTRVWGKDCCKYRNLNSTLDTGLKKIVLRKYEGNKSQINLARFFVSNARLLESMRFETEGTNVSTKWIARQQRLLQIKKSASKGAQFDFVSPSILPVSVDDQRAEQVHDLSADPFHRFH